MIPVLTSLAFMFGVLLQSYFLVGGKIVLDTKRHAFYETDWMAIIALAIFCVPCFFIGFNGKYYIGSSILAFSIIYMGLFPAVFLEKILSVVTERKILQFNVILIFIMFLLIYDNSGFIGMSAALRLKPILTIIMLMLLVIPTIGTILLSFTRWHLRRSWKILFYMWFLTMNISIILYQLSVMGIFKFILQENITANPIEAFTLGMVLLLLMSNVLFLFMAFNTEGTNARDTFNQKYSNNQMSAYSAVIIILSYSILLFLNHHLGLVQDYVMINVLLLSTYFYDYLDRNKTVINY
ncbi:MAG: hypothetical protein ACP5OA_00400 [Candidatus Woesearchaeota archaeon]